MPRSVLLIALGWLSGCASSAAPPRLDAVVPALVDGREGTSLQLVGHFPPAVTVDLDEPAGSTVVTDFNAGLVGGVRLALEVTWLDEGRLLAWLEAGAPSGTYSVVVTDARGQRATLLDALEVLTDGGLLPDGGSDCALTYEDGDGDGWGLESTAAVGCGPGRTRRGQDCDDGDALSHPEAVEVCNRLDDDCDGLVDEGACPPDAGWTVQPPHPGPSENWQTASSYAPGAVWIAGGDLVWHRAGTGGFEPRASSCFPSARASWASSDGTATIGFGIGRWGAVALATAHRSDCAQWRWTRDSVVGVVGFELDGGAVTVAAASRHGRLWRFAPGGRPVELAGELSPGAHLADLHGLGPDALVAVGSAEQSGRPRAYFWTDGGWSGQALPGSGAAHGVWVAAAGSTFVVGDDGLAVESKDGGWVQLGELGELGGASLRAVRAFGSGRVYTVEREGRVRRWSRGRWEVLVELGPGAPLNDITGTSEEDLWVVGDHGLVLHWP